MLFHDCTLYILYIGVYCLKATEPLWGDALSFTNEFPEIPDTHSINSGMMKGGVELEATQWFWTRLST